MDKRKFSPNMVINLKKLTMVSLLLTIVNSNLVKAQGNIEYSELRSYRNWGIIAGPVLFDRAAISSQYGDYTYTNKPLLGFNAGFEYNFFQSYKWSFMTGLIVSMEPLYNIELSIKKEDLYSGWNDINEKFKSHSMTSFTVPILAKINIQSSRHLFFNIEGGLQVKYFPPGEAQLSLRVGNEEISELREIFGLKVVSPDNSFQGSFLIGTGCSYTMKKVLMKANMIYVMNFQNIISGEYLFGNLFNSDDSRGYYDLSGNYLGVLFSVSLKKSKH